MTEASSSTIVARNASWLIAQTVFTSIFGIVVTAVVARALGATDYGRILIVLSYVAIFGPISSLGTRTYCVREIAASPASAPRLVAHMILLRVPLSLAGAALAFGFAHLSGDLGSSVLSAFLAAQLVLVAVGGCFMDGLYGTEHIKLAALTEAIASALTQVASLAAVFLGAGVDGIVMAYLVGSAATAVIAFAWFTRRVGSPAFEGWNSSLWYHVWESRVFFIQALLMTLRQRLDLIVVNSLMGAHAAGLYGVARGLTDRIDFLHVGVSSALYPRVATLHERGSGEVRLVVRNTVRLMFALSAAIAVGLFGTSDAIIRIIFGPEFEMSAPVLRILCLGVPLIFVYALVFTVLRAIREEALVLKGTAVALAAWLAASVPAIHYGGIEGAAWAYIGGATVNAAILIAAYWRRYGSPLGAADFLKVVAANLVMGAWLYASREWSLALRIPVAIGAYMLIVGGTGVMTLAMLKGVLARGR